MECDEPEAALVDKSECGLPPRTAQESLGTLMLMERQREDLLCLLTDMNEELKEQSGCAAAKDVLRNVKHGELEHCFGGTRNPATNAKLALTASAVLVTPSISAIASWDIVQQVVT